VTTTGTGETRASENPSMGAEAPVSSSPMDSIKTTSAAPEAPASISTSAPWGNSPLDHIILYDWGTYYGAAPANFNMNTPNENTTTAAQNLDNAIIGGYRIDQDTYIGGMMEFDYRPVGGSDATMMDPAIRFGKDNWIKTGPWQLYADLRAYLPVSTASQNAKQDVQLRSFQNLTYEVKGTRWTLGAYGSLRYYVYSDPDTLNPQTDLLSFSPKQRVRAYVGPNVNYQVSPSLSIFVLGEAEGVQNTGNSFWNWNDNGMDIEPGVMWNITPKLMINPFINVYPTSPNVAKTTYIGANIWISVL
jgi:hypothetical protein